MRDKALMHGSGESYNGVVPTKQPNKGETSPAEAVEERPLTKENTRQSHPYRTPGRESGPSGLERVREAAKQDGKLKFTALLYHVSIDLLRVSYYSLKKQAAPGVDGMTWEEYGGDLETRLSDLHGRIHRGAYRAQPWRRVWIPKADGRQRPLGIAALEDKVVQHAVGTVLNQIWEEDFLGFSYRFRPRRGQTDALDAPWVGIVRKRVNWILDIAKRVEDKRLLKLIRAFLNAGVMENGLVSPSVEGTPQGGPLSPLLSNLVLDELDRELERRGHRFVRYADDCSERAGQRVMESVTRFITQELKLMVNEAKSGVARPQERKFLGFSFTAGPEVKRAIAPKALERFKQRIREITRRAKGVGMETTMEELAPYMRGWRGYFGFCETPEVLIGLTRWVRLRLRAALWGQWKTPRRCRAALLELGVREPLAGNTAGSGRGPWYLARAKALSVGLPNAYFKSLGLPSLFEEC